ncbi:MAG: serine/threonine protein kinase [Archangium sp.]|nr:serine/threonine protein kinase [Archangium sp.]
MTDASPLQEGVVVSETYDVERRLGRGGMGEVWLARHRRLSGKQVAIKVLRTPVAQLSPDVAARFRREAEIAARLEHPNIVQVLDFNQLPSGEPYLVMEYLKGESLAGRLAAGPLSFEAARAVVRQVGAALQVAHAAGVVHRDLKPDNIVLVPTALGDQVKVLDFGISKLADGAVVQTTEATLLGTPLYMSPEQALGKNKEVSAQSDVFSLGSVCYELLSGQAPFRAESVAQVVFRIAYEPHRPLREVAQGVPDEAIAAIEHALVKDKAQRTPDVATFVHAFTGEALQATAMPSAPTPSAPSGVATPGGAVSESLLMGATATPGPGVVPKPATPMPLPPPRRTSWAPWVVATGMLVLGGVVAAWRAQTRADEAASAARPYGVEKTPLAAVRDPTVNPSDAGAVVMDATGPSDVARDGGSAAMKILRPATTSLQEGTPAPGVVGRQVKPAAAQPLSDDEKTLVAELSALAKTGAWDAISARRMSAINTATTAEGKRALWLLLLEAECARRDVGQLNGVYNRLDALGDAAVVRRARAVCRTYMPDWTPP